jgi:hypothetical protein
VDLISCNFCGVVLNKKNIRIPETENSDGDLEYDKLEWDGETYRPVILCPVCGADIIL